MFRQVRNKHRAIAIALVIIGVVFIFYRPQKQPNKLFLAKAPISTISVTNSNNHPVAVLPSTGKPTIVKKSIINHPKKNNHQPTKKFKQHYVFEQEESMEREEREREQKYKDYSFRSAPSQNVVSNLGGTKSFEQNGDYSLDAAQSTAISAAVDGKWIERGAKNMPGRVCDIDIDYTNKNIYALTKSGFIFKSKNLEGNDWKSLNDNFPVACQTGFLKVFPGRTTRIISSGWFYTKINKTTCYYSDNDGKSWTESTGLDTTFKRMRKMMVQGDTVYIAFEEKGTQLGTQLSIYKSVNKATSFSLLSQLDIPDEDVRIREISRTFLSDMWVPNESSNPNIYVLAEDSLFIVNKYTGVKTFNSVNTGKVQNTDLTGNSTNGVVKLYSWNCSSSDTGRIYSWTSAKPKWEFQSLLTEFWKSNPYLHNSFACSKLSANDLMAGAILTLRSTDGGKTWPLMSFNKAKKIGTYHGDVPKVMYSFNPQTKKEDIYMGTDGGVYKYNQAVDSNISLGLNLNNIEVYSLLTDPENPTNFYIGTQDNGVCAPLLNNTANATINVKRTWGGDVVNIVSGDGLKTMWIFQQGGYACFTTKPKDQPDDHNSVIWEPSLVNGEVPYWKAPVCVSTSNPNICYIPARPLLFDSGQAVEAPAGNYLLKLRYYEEQFDDTTSVKQIETTPLPFNFDSATSGGIVNSIAISSIDEKHMYTGTKNGYFFRSSDSGKNWTSTLVDTNLNIETIYASKIRFGEIYIGGSGSNSPVYHSTDHGKTFKPATKNIAGFWVKKLTANQDESLLFAGTRAHPFAYEVATSTWFNIANNTAPQVEYHDVEFINKTNTVRFGSYGRGVWDYLISETPPVQWLLVNAKLNSQNKPLLQFSVKELNVTKYEIAKSVDGTNFRNIGVVNSKGNGENSYSFTENMALTGSAYFQIKQVSNNGKITYSKVMKLTQGSNSSRLGDSEFDQYISIYPNPSDANITIKLGKDYLGENFAISNLEGKPLIKGKVSTETMSFNISDFPEGVYLFILENSKKTIEFIKQ